MGCFLQFRSLFHCQIYNRWIRYRQYSIQDCGRAIYHPAHYISRSYSGYHLEPGYLVERDSVFFLTNPYWSFAGAAIMANGFEAIQLNIILKIAAFIFLAPFIGMVIAFGFTLFVLYICRRAHPHTAEQWFKRLQLVSSALFSVGHGLNDSQKVMGIIAAAMIAGHSMGLGMGINSINDLPDWVAFSCFTAISLGTMSGGWKIVKTMGTKITKVTPLEGVIAETAGAFTLYITEMLKIPVSTTHTITGAIIGVGATKRLSAVRWGVTKSLMTAWILTIPVSGLLAAAIYYIVSIFL